MTTKSRRIAPVAPVLPNPPQQYDIQYMQRLLVAMQNALLNIENPATLRGGWLNLSSPRLDAFNLTEGDVWIEGNTLKIARVGDFGSLGSSAAFAVNFNPDTGVVITP